MRAERIDWDPHTRRDAVPPGDRRVDVSRDIHHPRPLHRPPAHRHPGGRARGNEARNTKVGKDTGGTSESVIQGDMCKRKEKWKLWGRKEGTEATSTDITSETGKREEGDARKEDSKGKSEKGVMRHGGWTKLAGREDKEQKKREVGIEEEGPRPA
ncbi:hypothetical protein NDU88_005598 [Pleurodeles waltl]|uniref:Uncharacterized protein n=1 Tax=Pleurodeles waltl TaxID=8319 RepID=A0AAV7LUJ1_PLEWA|nr:hypothetical protein NDU88_005598 [Pleurodeles waltl]